MDLRPSNWIIEKYFMPFQRWRIERERKEEVSRITENIYIGDLVDAQKSIGKEEYASKSVLNLMASEISSTDLHAPLKDGYNRQKDFNNAVNSLREIVHKDDKVLVHCAAGQSRSCAVVTAHLMEDKDMSISKALKSVEEGVKSFEGRNSLNIDEELRDNVIKYSRD